MKHLFVFFLPSIVITAIALSSVTVIGGLEALYIAALLSLLEITLSFDNAVVNARVLKSMSKVWQRRFLTWGILIAVFGTRFVLPIVIVSVVAWMSPWAITMLAVFDPEQYGNLLHEASYAIHSFGATFLVMVALKYFLDDEKDIHWIHALEKHLKHWGRIEAMEIVIALAIVLTMSFFVPAHDQAAVLISGIVGVVLFIVMQGITSAFSIEARTMQTASVALFIYLEILDTAFSLDGVIGAFALTNSIPIIAAGLGIGAFFVRSLTVYMVQERTLDTLRFLEHGAHWAIFGLAASMYASLITDVPEIITGSIGIAFVLAAYYSSLRRST